MTIFSLLLTSLPCERVFTLNKLYLAPPMTCDCILGVDALLKAALVKSTELCVPVATDAVVEARVV